METPYWLSRLIYSFFYWKSFRFLMECSWGESSSRSILFLLFAFYHVLSCTVLYCPILYCHVMYCPIVCRTVMYCHVLSYPVLYCTVLCCPVLYCLVLSCTVLSYSAITPWYAGIYHLSHISSSILMSIISSSSSQYWRTLCRLARIQLRGLDLIEYDRK